MMNCPNCNQPLADGRKFCVNCGCPADAPYFFDANALGTGCADVLTKKYACFQGRARRKEYWMFILLTWIISFVLRILLLFSFSFCRIIPFDILQLIFLLLIKFVCFVYLCGIGIPEAALTVRRFQDIGEKRWLALLLWGGVWGLGVVQIVRVAPVVFILQFIFIIPIFILASFDSQLGPNKYGPNPKGM